MTTLTNDTLSAIRQTVERQGHWHGGGFDDESAKAFVLGLGTTLFATDVTVRDGSKALVTSDRALDFHTDHHRADLICWHCIEQTDQGGETLLLDSYQLFARLDEQDRLALQSLLLFEHRVFDDDPSNYPFLSQRHSRQKIYYSFWMLKDEVEENVRAAFDRFRKLTQSVEPIRFRLQPGDILVIDNGRMLHARTRIEGNRKRLLKRYWIETQTQETNDGNNTCGSTTD